MTREDTQPDLSWLEAGDVQESDEPTSIELAPTPPEAVDESEYAFAVPCPLCGTRQETDSSSIGLKVRCPDCHVEFVVREPHRSARRPRSQRSEPVDAELRLSEAPPSIERSSMADEYLAQASRSARPTGPLPEAPATARKNPSEMILETLRQAEREVAAEEAFTSPGNENPLGIPQVLRVFGRPGIWLRWLMMSAALWVELGAIQSALELSASEGTHQILGLLMGLIAFVVGALLFSFLGTSLLLITQHSAHGRDSVEGWPGPNLLEWMFDCWSLFASLFLTLAPVFLLSRLLRMVGAEGLASTVVFLMAPLMMIFAFPMLQLSFMENSFPYSRPVWSSVRISARHWFKFWGYSAVVSIIVAGCVALRVRSHSSVLNFFLAALMMLGLVLYFRLLGRLSWICEFETGEADESLPTVENGK